MTSAYFSVRRKVIKRFQINKQNMLRRVKFLSDYQFNA